MTENQGNVQERFEILRVNVMDKDKDIKAIRIKLIERTKTSYHKHNCWQPLSRGSKNGTEKDIKV